VIAADKIPEIGGVVLKDLSLNSAALAKLSSSGTGVTGVVASSSDKLTLLQSPAVCIKIALVALRMDPCEASARTPPDCAFVLALSCDVLPWLLCWQ
jgi:hypothetical protein